MMKTQLQLAAFIVHFGLVFVYPYNKNGYQFWDPSTLSAKNNLEEKKNFIKTLQNGVSASQHVFDTMKSELQKAQNMNTQKRNFNRRSNIFEKNMMRKREIDNLQRYNYSMEPYFFPDIEDGNAINATIELLHAQMTHQTEIDRLFQVMLRKNKKNPEYKDLEHSIDGIIEFAAELINNGTKMIEVFLKDESSVNDTDDFKREPFKYKHFRELTDCWKFIDDFIDDYIQMYDFDVDREVEAMKKPIETAIDEISLYGLYLDDVYKETGKERDEYYFRYPKYGRPYLQPGENCTTTEEPRRTMPEAYQKSHWFNEELNEGEDRSGFAGDDNPDKSIFRKIS